MDGGNKDICEKFDNAIISCIDGICTVYSNVYRYERSIKIKTIFKTFWTSVNILLHFHATLKIHSNFFSCTFNSTLDDIIGGRERDGDVDPIWNDKDGKSRGYCLCNEVIYLKTKCKNI